MRAVSNAIDELVNEHFLDAVLGWFRLDRPVATLYLDS